MKIKTADLTGAALEWAVDVARTGRANLALHEYQKMHNADLGHASNWAYGGPIIERESVELTLRTGVAAADGEYHWVATRVEGCSVSEEVGTTPLIAAMRCYVASQLGDEIDVPDELINN